MLANSGTAPLTVSRIIINSGANPGDFAQSNNCPVALAANSSCTISVTFSPTAVGARSAILSITDNNLGSPIPTTQTVSLSGTGTSFSITVSPSTKQTISPGKYETYTLTLTPISGFTGTVYLGCSVTPVQPKTTCTTPISANITSPGTMFISASAKNSSKGTFVLTFSAAYTATAPAAGTLSMTSAPVTLTVK